MYAYLCLLVKYTHTHTQAVVICCVVFNYACLSFSYVLLHPSFALMQIYAQKENYKRETLE